MKRLWLATASAAILSILAGTSGDPQQLAAQTAKLRVGVVLPLSGQFALGGQNVKRGYDLAADDINAVGGIKALGGAQMELVYADNQGKQDVAIGETERLIQQERVSAIMGSWHSPTTIAGTQASERNKTPWIVEVASADIVVERGFKYVSRVNVKASWYGEAPVDYLDYAKNTLKQKVERVAIMYTDDDWGRSSVGKGTKDALQKRGYQIVEEIAYPSASQDVTTYINKIKGVASGRLCRDLVPERLCAGRTHDGATGRQSADRDRRVRRLRVAVIPHEPGAGRRALADCRRLEPRRPRRQAARRPLQKEVRRRYERACGTRLSDDHRAARSGGAGEEH
jgi:Periplasmic binding protein